MNVTRYTGEEHCKLTVQHTCFTSEGYWVQISAWTVATMKCVAHLIIHGRS